MSALAQIDASLPALVRGKTIWITDARQGFAPTIRTSCTICGKFKAITQAHHVTPLAAQYAAGFIEPDHTHVWLCPNHHAAVHLLLNQMAGKRIPASREVVSLLNELADAGENSAILDLAVAARCGAEAVAA